MEEEKKSILCPVCKEKYDRESMLPLYYRSGFSEFYRCDFCHHTTEVDGDKIIDHDDRAEDEVLKKAVKEMAWDGHDEHGMW